jgi:hypothetical protein
MNPNERIDVNTPGEPQTVAWPVTLPADKLLTAYDDLPFGPLAPNNPVQIALVWGNPETGPPGCR